MGTKLSVKVGLGLPPSLARGLGDGAFWRYVETIEALGYDSLWLSDTLRPRGLAPLPMLAAVAARTTTLKLGTGVLALPWRPPSLLAHELATIDALSGGRLLPAGGIGTGGPADLAAIGVRADERAARLEESVLMIKALWRGEPVTMPGRFWSLENVTLVPRPHRPELEFWLGATAPVALERIGRIADGWLGAFVGPEEFGRGVQIVRAAAAAAGRTIDEDHYGTTIFAAPTADDVPAGLAPLLDRRPGVARADHVGIGVDATRALLERFIAQGGTKFVLIPVARDPLAWVTELWPQVVAPLEAAGSYSPIG